MQTALKLVLGVALALLVAFGPVSDARAQDSRYGIGIYGAVMQPLGVLKDWYNTSPEFIGQLTYVVSPRTLTEVEFHYTMLSDSGLSDRTFTWYNGLGAANNQKVKSSSAKADMYMASLLVNGLRTFKDDEVGRGIPYIAAGIGFYRYKHDVEGLIWPGQVGSAIQTDTQSMLEPTTDQDVALSINAGLGMYYRTSETFMVDFRLRWNVSMGELRPYEDWDLQKTFPIQSLNFMVGIKYFLQ